MPDPERVVVDVRDDGVAVLRLVRAEAHNAIDLAMASAIADAARLVEGLEGVRAVLVCADGPSFTVGGDLAELRERRDAVDEHLEAMLTPYHDGLERLASLPVPVVCAAQGPVCGGGLGLLWCADVVLVADDARLVGAFGALGLSNDSGSSWWLPRLVGLRRAQELMLTGRTLSADEAVDWGLATRAVSADALRDEALAAATALAQGPTVALGEQRRLLREGFDRSLHDQLAEEKRTITHCARTDDAGAGVDAFLERRPPEFRGR